MPSTDITYCTRDCGNMECKRNIKNYPKEGCYYVWMCDFKDCKEWSEINERL